MSTNGVRRGRRIKLVWAHRRPRKWRSRDAMLPAIAWRSLLASFWRGVHARNARDAESDSAP
jgi:hypothetical protein